MLALLEQRVIGTRVLNYTVAQSQAELIGKSSKHQPHAKLDLAGSGRSGRDPPYVPADASPRVKEAVSGQAKIGPVEKIEKLGAELQMQPLGEGSFLPQHKIQLG